MGRRQSVVHSFSVIEIEKLYLEISFLFHQVQVPILQGSDFLNLALHWKIGRLIVEYEQQQVTNDEDHHELLSQLSERLTKELGEQFDFLTLEESCKFYLTYSLSSQNKALNRVIGTPYFQSSLTWNHYRLLIHVRCPQARNFYEKEANNSNWPPSLLNHFIKKRLFERLSTSTNKENVLRSAQQGSLELFSNDNETLSDL
ncbi:MAG: hypothetical protein K2P93_06745 [Alphaproteobacteria bacterium]|nr:hypothetical protein [Alphaproteobacteria bacterium]